MKILGYSVLSAMLFCSFAVAEDALPPNTIDCTQFKKDGGQWIQTGESGFDVGSIKNLHVTNTKIGPHSFVVDKYGLFDILNKKCGG